MSKKNANSQSFVALTNTSNPGLTKGKTMDGIIYEAIDESYRLDYLQQAIDIASDIVYSVNPQSKVGLVTFAKSIKKVNGQNVEDADKYGPFGKSEYNQLINDTNEVIPDGGTNQYAGLVKAKEFWDPTPDADHQRVVIMITDGAPNVTTSGFSNRNSWDKIQEPADDLKNKATYGATIYTVGLSLGNVLSAEAGLRDHVASPGYAFSAPTGRDLVQKILDIIDTLFTEAKLYGSMRDVVDPAFYPVDSNGEPLAIGFYNDDGERLEGENLTYYINNSLPYHLWMSGDENWTVTWYNEHIGEGTTEDPALHKSFLVKAKEDFLGGNTISTNSGEAQVTATTYIEKKDATNTRKQLHTSLTAKAATPYVNIDELYLNDHETSWTVYLNTNVDPMTQLKEMFKDICFWQVVTDVESGLGTDLGFYSYRLKKADGSLIYEPAAGNLKDDDKVLASGLTPSSMPLVEVLHTLDEEVGWTDLSDVQWNKLLAGDELTFKYYGNPAYGHGTEDDPVGVITIKLTQTLADGESGLPDAHQTSVTNEENDGNAVEKYNLTVTYNPTNPKAVDYKTGSYVESEDDDSLRPGKPADTPQSINIHDINVFVKKLQILKKDKETQTLITDKQAAFTLYKATGGEVPQKASDIVSENGTVSSGYEAVAVLTTNISGPTAGKTDLYDIMPLHYGMFANDADKITTYYLVETAQPTGYMKSAAVWPVTLSMSEDPTNEDGTAVVASSLPYDWTQKATLAVGNQTSADSSDTATIEFSVDNEKGIDIEVLKVDEKGEPLDLAKFRLQKKEGTYQDIKSIKVSSGSDDLKYPFVGGLDEDSSFVSGTEKVTITKLPDGEYKLIEDNTRDGYIIKQKDITFTIANGILNGTNIEDIVTFDKASGANLARITITNEPGAVLPATGGPGTTFLYILGIMLMAIAGSGLALSRRRGKAA